MAAWTSDELDRIGSADELHIAGLRPDGTLRDPVTIWVVRDGDDLYVRSFKGRTSGWFRGTQARHEGRVDAGGVTKDVDFTDEGDASVNERLDAAYRAKYQRFGPQYVDPMVAPAAREATLRLTPRS